jgi:hypothetical protein
MGTEQIYLGGKMKKYLFFIVLFVSFTIGLFGIEIFVDGNNTQGPWYGTEEDPFQFIQDAIDIANDRDIITVADVEDGEYLENLVIENKSLTLRNENWESGNWNPENCVIDGGGSGDVIYINNCGSVTIQGFTIKNSGEEYIYQSYYDAGIKINLVNTIIVENNIFSNNRCAVYMTNIGNTVEVIDNVFNDIIHTNGSNSKYIFWNSNQIIKIQNNQFYLNYLYNLNKGLLDFTYGSVDINNNEFSITSNGIPSGGIIFAKYVTLLQVSNNNFCDFQQTTILSAKNTDIIMNENIIYYDSYTDGYAILCSSENNNTGHFNENLIVNSGHPFTFTSTGSSTETPSFNGFFTNNTTINSFRTFTIGNNPNSFSQNNISEFKNNIIWDFTDLFYFSIPLQDPIEIEYSCIEGGVPVDPSIINGEGNIDANPLFEDPGNILLYPETHGYGLTLESPCIDTGDPDTDGDGDDWIIDPDDRDPDGSRKDMGCFPFLHNYDTKHFGEGIQWLSFPNLTEQGTYPPFNGEVFEKAYYENSLPGLLQETAGGDPTINGFDIMYGNRVPGASIDYDDGVFIDDDFDNMLFRHEGYKIVVTEGADPTTLIVDGERLEYYVLDMTELENYWLGYYLLQPESQNIEDAFGAFWGDVNRVWAEDWYYDAYKIQRGGDPQLPANSTEGKTMEYGKMYIVQMYDDVDGFHWDGSGTAEEPSEKATSQYFSYTEKADYEAIDVVSIPPNVLEIGVFEEDVCVGAVVVEDSCAQILVYSENVLRDPIPFTFEIVTGRGISTPIKDYLVLDLMTGEFEPAVIISGRQGYSAIKLGEQEEPEDETPAITKPMLHRNYPNPFNPTTNISFSLPKEDDIELTIYNIKGQKVKTLYSGIAEEGKHSMVWEGKDTNGKSVSSGIYFYKLKTESKELTRKMLLLK